MCLVFFSFLKGACNLLKHSMLLEVLYLSVLRFWLLLLRMSVLHYLLAVRRLVFR